MSQEKGFKKGLMERPKVGGKGMVIAARILHGAVATVALIAAPVNAWMGGTQYVMLNVAGVLAAFFLWRSLRAGLPE